MIPFLLISCVIWYWLHWIISSQLSLLSSTTLFVFWFVRSWDTRPRGNAYCQWPSRKTDWSARLDKWARSHQDSIAGGACKSVGLKCVMCTNVIKATWCQFLLIGYYRMDMNICIFIAHVKIWCIISEP